LGFSLRVYATLPGCYHKHMPERFLHKRRDFLAALAAGAVVPRAAFSDPVIPNSVETSGVRLMTADTRRAIERGLKWLAARQNSDGAFGVGRGYGRDVGVVALAGMGFLSSGSTAGRGPFGVEVTRATDFILESSLPSGFITNTHSPSHGPMYGHGFATLFLAEVYGMSPRRDLREKLQRAVRMIVACQNHEGGWRYENVPKEADISVTVCQIMALRAARNSGIFVPKDTVDRCIDYVRGCQNRDGGFRYRLKPKSSSQFARSAAGVVALYSAGVYEDPAITRGLNYLKVRVPRGFMEAHYWYGQYYAVQAMYQAGDPHWERWYTAIRDQLIRDQLPDGSWTDLTFSSEYATAMALIILQLPNNHLPIMKR
jgi:hypothetical protein